MFKNSIVSTPLTTDAANAYFSNITGQKYGTDNSFLATLRALVAPRMKEEDAITLKFGRTDYNAGAIRSVPGDRGVRAICDSYHLDDVEGNVIIHNLTADTDSNQTNLQILDSYFVGHYMGYHRLEKVKEFYRKAINVDCYINPEKKNVILFVDKLDNKKLHYLQQSILAILPWYFDPSNGVSELEMELIQSLRETTSEKYEDCLVRVAEKYDFKTARIRQLLGGFETRFERIECDRVRNDIEEYDRRISRLNDDIGSLLATRNECCIRLLGLETKIANGGEDSEIMDYFLCNHKLFLEEVTDTDMYFSVKDYLTYFDRDMAEVAINNPNSFVYHNGRNGEYYSEDPVLSGVAAMEFAIGALEYGLVAAPKHFAFNDQESERGGVSPWMTEQRAREVELRAYQIAFEATKYDTADYDAGMRGLMTSFSKIGAIECTSSYGLMTEILANEWNFIGYAVTDIYDDTDLWTAVLNSGTTCFDTRGQSGFYTTTTLENCSLFAKQMHSDPLSAHLIDGDRNLQLKLKDAVHKNIYSWSVSHLMNRYNSTTRFGDRPTWWRTTYQALEIGSGVLAAACAVMYVLSSAKKKEEERI